MMPFGGSSIRIAAATYTMLLFLTLPQLPVTVAMVARSASAAAFGSSSTTGSTRPNGPCQRQRRRQDAPKATIERRATHSWFRFTAERESSLQSVATTIATSSTAATRPLDGSHRGQRPLNDDDDTADTVVASSATIPSRTTTTTPTGTLPSDVVRALDLVAVAELVVAHCGTFRGRTALMATVGGQQQQQQQQFSHSPSISTKTDDERRSSSSRRQSRLDQFQTVSSPSLVTETSNKWGIDEGEPLLRATGSLGRISYLAHSAAEIAAGYQPVEEATRLIQSSSLSSDSKSGDCTSRWPPLYAAECNGPLDVTTTRLSSQSDDDDWLYFSSPHVSSGAGRGQWTLEHVVQAHCVLTKLVRVIQWSRSIQTVAPTVAALLWEESATTALNEGRVQAVAMHIAGAVQIVKVRTLMDPTGQSTFQFQLCRRRFPDWGRLCDRRDTLQAHVMTTGRDGGTITNRSTPQSERMVRDVARLQDEIATLEQTIASDLFGAIYSVRRIVDNGLNAVAALDLVFAKAAFGCTMSSSSSSSVRAKCNIGCSPSNGSIRVEQFVHPLLYRSKGEMAVPIDLILGDTSDKALVISGSNGGGKSVAMKSFGLVSLMAKLAIPIATTSDQPIVDFFDHIICSVGDYQNVQEGESTYTSLLKRYDTVMKSVVGGGATPSDQRQESYLVLLDELGSGTDETSGGVIGQAVVEKLLATESCRIVATTHSPRLKTWSFNNATSVKCAAVLLDRTPTPDRNGDSLLRKPSFKLQYNCIGESYAFGAASRCLPEDVVLRASALLDAKESGTAAGTNADSSYMRALTESLELQLTTATEDSRLAEELVRETALLQQTMKSLAAAYDDHLSRLQSRVENCYHALQQSQTSGDPGSDVRVLGETLAELRLVQTRIKSEQEVLSERGLKRLPEYYGLSVGESVVVIDDTSEWHGMTATVLVSSGSARILLNTQDKRLTTRNDVVVEFSGCPWDFAFFGAPTNGDKDVAVASVDANLVGPTVLQRYQLAIWDYNNDISLKASEVTSHYSVPESKRKLNSLLSTLSTITGTKPKDAKASSKAKNAGAKTTSAFTSSRERKAAKRKL